jgi:tetratricopeptide (TPR) repeat protein
MNTRIKINVIKKFLLIIALWGISNASAQDSIQVLWERANAYYTTENYLQAVASYEQIREAGLESAKLYFNLGNAYYKTGDINYAILNYERARLLAPNDEDIEFNLRLANQFVVTEIDALPQPFFIRWRTSIINLYSADTWAIFSIAGFILFMTLLGLFIFSRSSTIKQVSFWFGIFTLIVSAFTFSFASQQKNKINQRKHAIVFCPRVTVKSAPATNSTDLFLLYEGVKVEISDSVRTWREIKLPDGNVGWLPDSCMVRI